MGFSPPERVGRYRVVSELGHGGMGVVYLGERADGEFQQRVAIKLLSGGAARGGELASRLRTERQILAALDHPGIAKLLDGGSLDDGTPYLVMEYVEGERIDVYCERCALPLRDRVRLVLAVCDAVEAAHQRLIVHRDLKPGNILVTPAGTPKLLDFGIAKLLDPLAVDWTVAETERGRAPLTLRYASPEQVRGEPIGTASDVYSLGVVLFELLTGRSPYGEERGFPQLMRAIAELDPPAPSASAAPPAAAAGEATELAWRPAGSPVPEDHDRPERERRGLRGDLDAIVLKALRKEPDKRYPTVAALADDLRRFLDGRPVAARQGTLAYRAGKFVRRNRWPVAAAGAAALVLAGFVWSLRAQLARTERERDKARRVQALLVDAFEASDPMAAAGEAVTAREILERATPRLEAELADQPEILAPLLVSTGEIHLNLGMLDRAEAPLVRAVELQRARDGGDSRELRSALAALARLRSRQARFDEAIALLDEALGPAARWRAPAPSERADLELRMGDTLREAGRYDEAEEHLARSLRLLVGLHPGGHLDVAEARRGLATLAHERGDVATAEAGLRTALDELRRLGAPPARIAEAASDLSSILNQRGEVAAAETLLREALALERLAFGPDHPNVAVTLNNLAVSAYYRRAYEEASALLEEAISIHLRVLGDDHPDVAMIRINLSAFQIAANRPAEADATLAKVFAVLERFPDTAPATLTIALRLRSTAAWLLGDLARARELIARASAAATSLPPDHPVAVTTRIRRVVVRRDLDEIRDAEGELRSALAIQRRDLPERHPDLVPGLAELASVLVEGGHPAEAESLARQALAVADSALAPTSLDAAWSRAVLGACLVALGRSREGRAELDAATPVLAARLAAGHPRLRRVAEWASAAAVPPRPAPR